jgi:hypothetical protein
MFSGIMMQQNPTRNPKHERSAQSQHDQMSNAQQMQQMQPQMYAGYREPYSQTMMSPQSSVEYVTSWKFQSMTSTMQSGTGGHNSGQYFQSHSQQMSRNAHCSQAMMQGNAGEAAQFVDPRTGPSQSSLVLQVSLQNQLFRQIDFRPMTSQQGMLSIDLQIDVPGLS